MALYLGNSKKLKINSNGASCSLKAFPKAPSTNGIMLLSSDGYILKDYNGKYLITKDGENNGRI